MKRLISSIAIGAFVAANSLVFNAAAANDWAVGGGDFEGVNAGDQTGLVHNGNGLLNNSGANRLVLGTISLSFPSSTTLFVQAFVYGPNAATTTCDVWETSSNGASQTGFGMTRTTITGGASFLKQLNYTSQSQTLAVACNMTAGSTLAMVKTFT